LVTTRGSVVGVYNGKQYITVEIKPVTVSDVA
jgi:ribosomal protein S19